VNGSLSYSHLSPGYGSWPLKDRTAPRPALPRHVVYSLLFRELVQFNARADELKLKPDAYLRNYHRALFDLSPLHDSQLKAVARDCVAAIDALDEQAHAIKRQYRDTPPPADELAALEAKRKAAVLGAVDRLRSEFGPAQFVLFDADVRCYFRSNTRRVTPKDLEAQ
jgi:hypothetical protein